MRGDSISVLAKGGDESCKVSVFWSQGNRVIANADLVELLGIAAARWNGVSMGWVCLTAVLLSACRSTVLLGEPSLLGHTTIREHHVVGSPMGTGSMTPSRTSRSSSSLTWACQCMGIDTGWWTATGFAFGSAWSWRGGRPVMRGSGW